MARDSDPSSESRIFLWTAAALLGVYLGLRYLIPWLAVWVGASQAPAPVPRFALAIYMVCAAVGALVYLSSDEQRWHLFLGPVVRLFVLHPGTGQRQRLFVLALLPLLAGWVAWRMVRPHSGTAAALRIQHPTLPSQYAERENPLQGLPEEERRAAVREGTVLFQKNCRPCHGTKAAGAGPLARGQRLRPIDFTDPGTITTVVEPYVFWRIEEGALGLPAIATPWNSAMPAWQDELEEDDIWRIIMAEYAIAGTEPRKPEGAEQ